MVVNIWVSTNAVLETNVQVIPETAVQNHMPHHPNPVFNLDRRHKNQQETFGDVPGFCRTIKESSEVNIKQLFCVTDESDPKQRSFLEYVPEATMHSASARCEQRVLLFFTPYLQVGVFSVGPLGGER